MRHQINRGVAPLHKPIITTVKNNNLALDDVKKQETHLPLCHPQLEYHDPNRSPPSSPCRTERAQKHRLEVHQENHHC